MSNMFKHVHNFNQDIGAGGLLMLLRCYIFGMLEAILGDGCCKLVIWMVCLWSRSSIKILRVLVMLEMGQMFKNCL